MPNLIIGHTTDKSVKVWVRGERKFNVARILLFDPTKPNEKNEVKVFLKRSTDFTAAVEFPSCLNNGNPKVEIEPNKHYQVSASFSPRTWWGGRLLWGEIDAPAGRFQAFPGANEDTPFSFLLGSCNLSIVKVNDLLGLILTAAGELAAFRSLEPVPHGWFRSIRWLGRKILGFVKVIPTFLVWTVTRFKQYGAPLLSSPFTSLCATIDTSRIVFKHGDVEPPIGTKVTGLKSNATGIVVSVPKTVEGSWRNDTKGNAVGELILGEVKGEFSTGENLLYRAKNEDCSVVCLLCPPNPAFMIHAGDQIYFDFPFRYANPNVKKYYRAYREAWFADAWAQYFLAQCPHYMTLDDHEITDDFATDFDLPERTERKGVFFRLLTRIFTAGKQPRRPEDYSAPALQAYRNYVHVRHPGSSVGNISKKNNEHGNTKKQDKKHSYFYDFSYGKVKFFVFDTRTERKSKGDPQANPPHMISTEQLESFRTWLGSEKLPKEKEDKTLRFVVSSVPFVAEVRSSSDVYRSSDDEKPNKRSTDKWAGEPYRAQRETIIRAIKKANIRNLIFLVGDMHCCYHATMQIGDLDKRITVHELAGGPIYQLRLGKRENFISEFKTVIDAADPSDPKNKNSSNKKASRDEELGDSEKEHRKGRDGKTCIPLKVRLEQLHDGASGVMQITVIPQTTHDENFRTASYRVDWRVIRTIPGATSTHVDEALPPKPPMSGSIALD